MASSRAGGRAPADLFAFRREAGGAEELGRMARRSAVLPFAAAFLATLVWSAHGPSPASSANDDVRTTTRWSGAAHTSSQSNVPRSTGADPSAALDTVVSSSVSWATTKSAWAAPGGRAPHESAFEVQQWGTDTPFGDD